MLVPCCVLLLCSSSRSLSISQVSLQAFHLTSKIYYAHRERRRRVSKPAALRIARSECVFIYLFFWKRACHALHELGAHHQPFSSRITVCWLMNNGSDNKNNVKNGILLLAHQSCGGVVSFFPPLELLALYNNYRSSPDARNLCFFVSGASWDTSLMLGWKVSVLWQIFTSASVLKRCCSFNTSPGCISRFSSISIMERRDWPKKSLHGALSLISMMDDTMLLDSCKKI